MFFSKGAKLVPMKEMPDALAVPRSSRGVEIARDAWVRVKNGLYKDDLGKVGFMFRIERVGWGVGVGGGGKGVL